MPQSDPIDFCFSIGSLFTFLTVMRIDRVEDMTDIRFVWRPFRVRSIMIEMDNRRPPSRRSSPTCGATCTAAPRCTASRSRARRPTRSRIRSCQPRRGGRRAGGLVRRLCARDLPALVHRETGMRGRAEPLRQPARDRRGPAPRSGARRGQRPRAPTRPRPTRRGGLAFSARLASLTRGEVFWGDDRLADAVTWHQRGTLGAPRPP